MLIPHLKYFGERSLSHDRFATFQNSTNGTWTIFYLTILFLPFIKSLIPSLPHSLIASTLSPITSVTIIFFWLSSSFNPSIFSHKKYFGGIFIFHRWVRLPEICLSLFNWLLNIITLKFIYFVPNATSSSFTPVKYSIEYRFHNFSVNLSVEGHLDWFHYLVTANSAAIYIGADKSFHISFHIIWINT